MSGLWDRLSLRVKLTLGYALIFSLSVLLGAAGVYLVALSTLIRSLDITLQETASVARASIEWDGRRCFFAPDLKPSGDLYVELLSLQGTPLTAVGQAPPGPPLPDADRRPGPVVAEQHGGTLRLSRAEAGGLLARIELPLKR